jgi:fumarate reductase subunit D
MLPPRSQYHRGRYAAFAHRLSGVLLAVFLPFHFLALGLALEGADRLDGLLTWSDQPIVKIAEWGLVTLLAVHLLAGLRVLVLEFLPWRDSRKGWVTAGGVLAAATGLAFLASALV